MVKIVVKKKNYSNAVIPLLPVSLGEKSRTQTVPTAWWGRNKWAARGGLGTEQTSVGKAVVELTLPGGTGMGLGRPLRLLLPRFLWFAGVSGHRPLLEHGFWHLPKV